MPLQIKPDGVQRGLVADIIRRFEQKGYALVGIKASPEQHACWAAFLLMSLWAERKQGGPGWRPSLNDSAAGVWGVPQVLVPSEDLAGKHYQEHAERPFYPGLVKFLASGPVVAMVWQGKDVIK